jgi:hypothetical protein
MDHSDVDCAFSRLPTYRPDTIALDRLIGPCWFRPKPGSTGRPDARNATVSRDFGVRGIDRLADGDSRRHHEGVVGLGRLFATGRRGPTDDPVCILRHAPTGSVLEPVVLAAEVGEIVVARVAVASPGGGVVEVASGGATAAAGEPQVPSRVRR